ncbi:MAG: peptidoglycan DD-metalloendopeptidase family protein [Gammaproteobacteria bacterium]
MNQAWRTSFSVTFFTALLPAVLLATLSLPLSAADTATAARAQELNRLREKIHALRDELHQTKSLHDSVRAELRQLESDIGERVHALNKIARQLRQATARLVDLKTQQRQYQRELRTQQTLLAQQVRAAYAIGRQEFLKLMLNQEDPSAVGRAMTYYDFFNRARSQRIATARDTISRLAAVKQDIETEQQHLRQLQVSQQTEKTALEQTSRSRALVVARLNSELQSKSETLARWLEDEKQLQRVVEAIQEAMPDILTDRGQRAVFSALRGQLAWPARGQLKALFGTSREAGQARWNGVLITADEGKEVRAISHGRVAYADWLRGYGLLVIVDHGEGYMSLYGHNQSLFKETGDWVEAGEVIGSVGKSGGQQDAALYFEIRHKGKPQNPVKWCKS